MRKFLLSVSVALMGIASAAAQTVYFSEDFEWFSDFTVSGKTIGDHVGTQDLDTSTTNYTPMVTSPKNADGEKLLDALLAKGYTFERVTSSTAGECIYVQKNYLKFGKNNYQAAITLPAIDNVPEGTEAVVSFDWCPMKGGTALIDKVGVIVVVTNGDTTTEFNAPEHGWETGHDLEWIRANVTLTGITVTKDTKITLKPTNFTGKGFARWMLDNIKVTENTASSIDAISADANTEVEYYNLQGIRVNNPEKGLYIEKKGKKDCKKVVIK